MKKLSSAINYCTEVVYTDGSTVNIKFPYKRKNVFLINDFFTNPLYQSPLNKVEKKNKFKEKNKHLNFNFNSLIENK
jgi:hypothetical protein